MVPLSSNQPRRKAVWGSSTTTTIRHKATWGFRVLAVTVSFVSALAFATDASAASGSRRFPKMDRDLETRAVAGSAARRSTVIVTLAPGTDVPPALQQYSRFGRLNGISGHVLDIPDSELKNVANLSQTVHVHPDSVVHGLDFRTDVTSGSFFVNHSIGLTGAGITVAVLDSGIAREHDDLPSGSVLYFKDFVNNKLQRYDDLGHGTHVAGIIAGRGTDSGGQMSGTAPGVKLVVLKVLDKDGNGSVSNVIAALDWLAVNGRTFGVRVVNLSFGAKPSEQPEDDPLALAAKALVDRGIVVVAAAGNNGQSDGKKVWGGIPSPADAPWVLTVGASSTLGTVTRKDDKLAGFSSRGPAVGRIAKPDLVASGVGTVSTISSEGTMYDEDGKYLVNAVCILLTPCPTTLFTPYMAMSGTSMAAPVVSGTVALMLQANPNLTPNLVKAILQYTAEIHSGYNALEQGAGFLNALGAVRLAQFYATGLPGSQAPTSPAWAGHIFWGNHRLTGGIMRPGANAWRRGVQWGSLAATASGDNIVWGTQAANDNIVWGTAAGAGDNIVWGTAFGDDNIVWGTDCGGANCGDNIVWGTDDGDNIVWGTDDGLDNIIWGTSFDDNIIWGTNDGDNIIWGTSADDNIVWGTDDASDNVVWGTSFTIPVLNLKLPKDPGYGWFMKPRNAQPWMLVEFGEGVTINTMTPTVRAGKKR
jgi:serine protease AprX